MLRKSPTEGRDLEEEGGADRCERRGRRKKLGKRVTDSTAAPGKFLAVARE